MSTGLDMQWELVADAGNLKIWEGIPWDRKSENPGFGFTAESEKSKFYFLKIQGEINLYTALPIQEILETKASQGFRRIFLDLSSVEYIDSSGLGAFLGIHSRICKEGGGVHLVSPSEKVEYVLVLTKLKGLIKIYRDWSQVWEENSKA